MHELSIIEDALTIAFRETDRAGATRIHRVEMRIGEMSGVVPDALRFAFDVATKDTIAEGADLELEIVPVQCRCERCGNLFHPDGLIYACPACQALTCEVLQGREIELTRLEVS